MYNGWKNRETWNVALWINNDYGIYTSACEFMRKIAPAYRTPVRNPYTAFIEWANLDGKRTPDNVKWDDRTLDLRALNAMMRELC